MFKKANTIIYSPSDLCRYMSSEFAAWMERYYLENPQGDYTPDEEDPLAHVLQDMGMEHETAFLQKFREQGKHIVEIDTTNTFAEKHQQTITAMQSGADVIFQACLESHPFNGYADFLVKVPGQSTLGAYHYEVWDTKLSKTPKPYYVIQLCCYADMLQAIQGRLANDFVVVLGNEQQARFPITDYWYYYKNLKQQFLDNESRFNNSSIKANMPDPADSTEWGRWRTVAEKILQDKDHLSQVANITRGQVKALQAQGIATVTSLAQTNQNRVPKISPPVFQRLKAQADIQTQSKGKAVPLYQIIQPQPGEAKGLALLPPHSPLDIFFDIEGYPLEEDGLEYLWGSTYFDAAGNRQFKALWAHDHPQEKALFQEFIHWVYARWQQDPTMHIYHYANYEIAACRKLMGRYGVCEQEVDQLLRNEVFVDLYKIVRHGLLIGEPSYSIKNVEHLYRGQRDTDVASGGESIIVYEKWRNDPDGQTIEDSAYLKQLYDYNKDDCDSTQELVHWLRHQQAQHHIAYIGKTAGDTQVEQKELSEEVTATIELREALLARAEQQRAAHDDQTADITETLAWLLEFHRREDKPNWWRLFDRLGLTDMELIDDLDCIVLCHRTQREPFKPTPRARTLAWEYAFDPNQEFKPPAEGKELWVLGHDPLKLTLNDINTQQGLLTVKAKDEPPPTVTLIPNDIVRAAPIPRAIAAVAERYLQNQNNAYNTAILDFLQRRPPRIIGHNNSPQGGPIIPRDAQQDNLPAIIQSILNLDNSYICIQGPPGTGKTYTGKHVIAELIKRGKKIGIASNSHKAINHLLLGVAHYCHEQGIKAHCCCTKETGPELTEAGIAIIKNADLTKHIKPGCVLGTTAWGFARDDMAGKLDYLFVDEAGQVSVANLVGMSRAANNLVLKGDQMQLGQPAKGTHPGVSGQSVLEYLLKDHATIPDELGIFLGTTYRMHPAINRFISDAIYEGRLKVDPDNQRQIIHLPNDPATRSPDAAQRNPGKTSPNTSGSPDEAPVRALTPRNPGKIQKTAGIIFIPVEHQGNAQASQEEADTIRQLTQDLLGRTYTDKHNNQHPLTWNDILYVAPYNYQVNILQQTLGSEARVGSVDKFQGQEAPVVFLSLCASNISDAPRGASFLLNKNRLNVAISRAKTLAIVVANPKLTEGFNGNLTDMKLVNTFYWLKEYANNAK